MTYGVPFEQLSDTQLENVADDECNLLALFLIGQHRQQVEELRASLVDAELRGYQAANVEPLRDVLKTTLGNLQSLVAARVIMPTIAEPWIAAVEDALAGKLPINGS